jgi:hypothetical protein
MQIRTAWIAAIAATALAGCGDGQEEASKAKLSVALATYGVTLPTEACNVYWNCQSSEVALYRVRFDLPRGDPSAALAAMGFPPGSIRPGVRKITDADGDSTIADWWRPDELGEPIGGLWDDPAKVNRDAIAAEADGVVRVYLVVFTL